MTVTAMPTSPPAESAEAPAPAKGGKKKIIVILVAVLALGGGGYWMFRPKPPAPVQPGEVVTLDPIQINLASAHYLRLGLALQLTDKAHEADGSKALDAAISEFSGRNIAELTDTKKREKLKKDLEHELEELYHGDVMGVYFTEFVTQ
ncbi:MAG: flagellar basal body-associated FliL family protein [Marmoricola sp.]